MFPVDDVIMKTGIIQDVKVNDTLQYTLKIYIWCYSQCKHVYMLYVISSMFSLIRRHHSKHFNLQLACHLKLTDEIQYKHVLNGYQWVTCFSLYIQMLRNKNTEISMMKSSNGNIFRVTGHLCGKFTGPRWISRTMPVTRSFDVFFDLRLNKRLSKQPWGWWFETPAWSLWRHRNFGEIFDWTLGYNRTVISITQA